jgi:hypothetical protein
MLVEMLDPHIKQLSCTSKRYRLLSFLFLILILIAIQRAWHQGHCMWQVLQQQAIVAVQGLEVGRPESSGYQSNAP